MRDHGGNLDWAIARWGGASETWVDLSTGINPCAYPVPDIPQIAWTALPTRAELDGLIAAARIAYDTQAGILPMAGAQAAIQLIPNVFSSGRARVLGPTYNEHAAALVSAGWQVETVKTVDALDGCDLAIVVNPNNPNGHTVSRSDLLALAKRVGTLVVDESFADPDPHLSVAPEAGGNLMVLRSFGKFYGLAGVRLGFALGDIDRLAEMAGPWPVSGAAIAIGRKALVDKGWAKATVARLKNDASRLDAMAETAGWSVVGGTTLFRLYAVEDAAAMQAQLAKHHIWSRVFPYSKTWIRLGLPDRAAWPQLEAALSI